MKRLWFTATLKADTVISKSSATTGGHSSLDYIPGACFLGAAAGKLYGQLGTEAYTAFHSGKVRFGNAYPLDAGSNQYYPVPLSWHVAKGDTLDEDGKLQMKAVTNLAVMTWQDDEKRQPKQVRNGYFSLPGKFVKPTQKFRLKTAIDRQKGGRAQDAQLFGYESLVAGSQWSFSIDVDDDVSETVVEALGSVFDGQTIRVGRSRSAEFGQLSVARSTKPQPLEEINNGAKILLYCLSDLALRHPETGAPTLIPSGEQFGLNGALLDITQTFLRSRSYAPFNAKRGANDLERQVLCSGSVITFNLGTPLTATEFQNLQERLANGIGLYRQDGLGRILLNPTFLIKDDFCTDSGAKNLVTRQPESQKLLSSSSSALIAWLEEQQGAQKLQDEAETLARIWLQEYQADLDKHRGPGRSQWGNLRRHAEKTPNAEALSARLFDQKQGLCHYGVSSEAWGQKLYARNKRQSFADLLQSQFDEHKQNPALLQKALYLLAKMAAHRINQKEAA